MLVFLLALSTSAVVPSEPVEDFDAEVAEEAGAMYGRLRHLEGAVTIRRGSEVLGDLVANEPLAPGDALVTGPDARAEIQLADGSMIRMDHDSELVLQSLPDGTGRIEDTTILQLASGSILVSAEAMDDAEKRFQIDTDTMSAFLLSEGIFRVDVEPGVTWVRSRRGAAEVTSNEASTMLRSGERVVVRAGEMPGEAHVVNTRMGDDFDAWFDSREDALVRTVHHGDAEPEVLPEPVRPYAAELSYYGSWHNNPSYGWVWSPAGLAATWRPYTYGRWSWSPAGMVWVSYEPWGWAPFHYGRWEYLAGAGWVWIPGYAFAGAHVAWSVSPGYFGWCPLGYYNYPVSYSVNFGWHHDPWVYVRADRIYNRRVHTIFVRDVTVVREIHRRAVVVRGHPRILPRRASAGPAFSEELHRRFSGRPDLQIRPPADSDRRIAFRDTERQRLARFVRRPERQARSVRPGSSGRSERMAADPTVSMPRPRAMSPDRPATVRGQSGQRPASGVITGNPVRRELPRREPSAAAPGTVTPRQGADRRQPDSGSSPGVRRDAPPRRPAPSVPVVRGQAGGRPAPSRPAQSQAPPRAEPRRASGSAPERVIPRMIPRSRTETQRSSPQSARPSTPAPRPSPARAQSSPPSRPSTPARSGGQVRGHSGGKDKGKKGKD
jgi:hypothetical protein